MKNQSFSSKLIKTRVFNTFKIFYGIIFFITIQLFHYLFINFGFGETQFPADMLKKNTADFNKNCESYRWNYRRTDPRQQTNLS